MVKGWEQKGDDERKQKKVDVEKMNSHHYSRWRMQTIAMPKMAWLPALHYEKPVDIYILLSHYIRPFSDLMSYFEGIFDEL